MVTNTFLDERCMSIWASPSGKRHVEGWFQMTLCGRWIDRLNWSYKDLTSVRYLGRVSRSPVVNGFCKRCVSEYKDVNVDAD